MALDVAKGNAEKAVPGRRAGGEKESHEEQRDEVGVSSLFAVVEVVCFFERRCGSSVLCRNHHTVVLDTVLDVFFTRLVRRGSTWYPIPREMKPACQRK